MRSSIRKPRSVSARLPCRFAVSMASRWRRSILASSPSRCPPERWLVSTFRCSCRKPTHFKHSSSRHQSAQQLAAIEIVDGEMDALQVVPPDHGWNAGTMFGCHQARARYRSSCRSADHPTRLRETMHACDDLLALRNGGRLRPLGSNHVRVRSGPPAGGPRSRSIHCSEHRSSGEAVRAELRLQRQYRRRLHLRPLSHRAPGRLGN